MGLDVADFDGDGDLDIYATDWGPDQLLSDEGPAAQPRYQERVQAAIGKGENSSAVTTGWGCALADLDNDGDLDVITASSMSDGAGYSKAVLLRPGRVAVYQNNGVGLAAGGVEEITDAAGEDLTAPINGFGLAVADMDQDGDLDVLVGVDHEVSPPHTGSSRSTPLLLENQGANTGSNGSLILTLLQPSPNRFAVGARVDVMVGQRSQSRVVIAGSSYLSHHGYQLHFGLGGAQAAKEVRVTWPGGASERWTNVSGPRLVLRRGEGQSSQ